MPLERFGGESLGGADDEIAGGILDEGAVGVGGAFFEIFEMEEVGIEVGFGDCGAVGEGGLAVFDGCYGGGIGGEAYAGRVVGGVEPEGVLVYRGGSGKGSGVGGVA